MICDNAGLTLVVIPYWWDKEIQSVAQTVHKARPDIVPPSIFLHGNVIPPQHPEKMQEKGTR